MGTLRKLVTQLTAFIHQSPTLLRECEFWPVNNEGTVGPVVLNRWLFKQLTGKDYNVPQDFQTRATRLAEALHDLLGGAIKIYNNNKLIGHFKWSNEHCLTINIRNSNSTSDIKYSFQLQHGENIGSQALSRPPTPPPPPQTTQATIDMIDRLCGQHNIEEPSTSYNPRVSDITKENALVMDTDFTSIIARYSTENSPPPTQSKPAVNSSRARPVPPISDYFGAPLSESSSDDEAVAAIAAAQSPLEDGGELAAQPGTPVAPLISQQNREPDTSTSAQHPSTSQPPPESAELNRPISPPPQKQQSSSSSSSSESESDSDNEPPHEETRTEKEERTINNAYKYMEKQLDSVRKITPLPGFPEGTIKAAEKAQMIYDLYSQKATKMIEIIEEREKCLARGKKKKNAYDKLLVSFDQLLVSMKSLKFTMKQDCINMQKLHSEISALTDITTDTCETQCIHHCIPAFSRKLEAVKVADQRRKIALEEAKQRKKTKRLGGQERIFQIAKEQKRKRDRKITKRDQMKKIE